VTRASPAPAAFAAGPLAGIRVLDLSTMLAGPYGATLLGDLGADVVKIESQYGDESRHLGAEKLGEHAPFLALNRNKRAIVLDLARPAAQAVFARLAATADVLVTNVREPALSRLGLDYAAVCRHRADVVWVGVTAFGSDGPYAGRPGIDFLAQGYAGLIAGNGDPSAPAARVTAPLVDVMTSMCVATGVLAALRVRDATGQGQRIDLSLLDVLTHAQATVLQSYLLAGEVVPRTGNRSHFFAPSGVYACGDGRSLCLTCPSEKFFRNLCRALGVAWADEARFARTADRLENQDALDALIAERCRDFSRDALLERLIAADVLAAPVSEIPDVVRDPQIRHNDMIVTTDHAALGPLEVTGVPIKLRGTPGSVRRAPPVQGQHTRELLAELGYAEAEIARLVEGGDVAESQERRR
jgi:crotonobetainyl-CoA:carnitine CoA-transferase CaiB-like acyl-CoA transferase